MTPLDIYTRFRIYRSLQEHQLRVAAIATFLARRATGAVSERLVTLTCLFHDMGNILKADPQRFPQFFEPEGIVYWQPVKDAFHKKYGDDEHVATEKIAREIGLPEEAIVLMDNLRFSRTEWILHEGTLLHKICKYADLRVAPTGVVPLEERLAEARVRYAGRSFDSNDAMSQEVLERAQNACRLIEKEVCGSLGVNPVDITDGTMAPFLDELKSYPVA